MSAQLATAVRQGQRNQQPAWHPVNEPPKFKDAAEAAEYAKWLISFQRRPLDWIFACYPWGEPGPLADLRPEEWQYQFLKRLQERLQAVDMDRAQIGGEVIRMCNAAGNGVGKTALVAWLIHWFESCFPQSQAVITASTEAQLQTKTWRELRKWQLLAVNGWMFEWTATRYKCRDLPETWFASAIPWSEANSQAFAGTHENYVLIIFDEASGIAPMIWDVIEGALTKGLCMFFAFGNPSEPEGGFWDIHNGKPAKQWDHFRTDARSVSFANQKQMQEWIDTYGADDDFCRVHIYGLFPKSAQASFIEADLVLAAAHREIPWRDIPRALPRLMGVDFGRQGGDANVIIRRQGRKMAPDFQFWHDRDTMVSAGVIARAINEWQPDLVYCDGVGIGGPIIDFLRGRGYDRLIVDVQSGEAPKARDLHERWANMRSVMWMRLREWLRIADIPWHQGLIEELSRPRVAYQKRTFKVLVESKEDMLRRGVASTNLADALAHTMWDDIPVIGMNAGYVEPEV